MIDSEFLQYLVQVARSEDRLDRLPPIKELSQELNVGISRLREQLEVAKALGLVDVRPRLGIRPKRYAFTPAVNLSLAFAIQEDPDCFEDFLDLRRHIEYAYLPQAVETLTDQDYADLEELLGEAWLKLRGRPVRIPHQEHRQFHLSIYRRLENVFVTGVLEAYWDAYEAVGLNVYADMAYLEQVWTYHQRVVEAMKDQDAARAQLLLREHFDLLMDRLGSR